MAGPQLRTNRFLAVISVLALVAVAFLAGYVIELRGEVDELSRRVEGAEGARAAASRADVEKIVRSGLEDLRVCFNKALFNSFDDFSRYVFGDLTDPDIEKIVETCGVLSTEVKAQLYKGGLDFPVDMAWKSDGDTIFFTEKATGNIRVLHGKQLVEQPCATVQASAEGERGTLGIVLDPDFESNGYLYVYYTNASPIENRVTRFVVEGDSCTKEKNLITGIPALDSTRHVGGQLEIVDGKLFVSVGDGYSDPSTAQDLDSPLGKILRYNLDGSVPQDNPFSEAGNPNPVWAMGHRNPFGLTHNPETSQIYASENGPNCDDELNLLDEGGNFGWGPGYECGSEGVGRNPIDPLVSWTPPIVPTDLWYYTGTTETLAGALYMGDFGSGKLHRFVMNEEGTKVLKDEVVYDSPSQIVDVSEGPGGLLYFLTPDGIYRLEER
jgi:glucose/arabinose dehydrogenase